MIEKSGKTHPLLLTTTQDILPLLAGIPSTLALGKISESGFIQNSSQVHLRLAFLNHIIVAIGVDDLISQGSGAEIWTLG